MSRLLVASLRLHASSVRNIRSRAAIFVFTAMVIPTLAAQSRDPYPTAVTDRLIRSKKPMSPKPRGLVFNDPDFGSLMIRVTDEHTDFIHPWGSFSTDGTGQQNEWNADTSKFWVGAQGGRYFVFGFDPSTMAVTSLPEAKTGEGFLVPLNGPTFSNVDPDLIYGTINRDPLTIRSYRMSTGLYHKVIDTRVCDLQPPLAPTAVSDYDISPSYNDGRISISEGSTQFDKHMFIVVYDKKLGCRWYNTQTGQIGGQWGQTGTAVGPEISYLIHHAYLSRSGRYVRIMGGWGFFIWDLATLNVAPCQHGSGLKCFGYGVAGYNSFVNGPAVVEDMQILKRPLSNLRNFKDIFWPMPLPHNWELIQHFSWTNVNSTDSTPICGSTYNYEGEEDITEAFEGEIFCAETDGLASTIWRFAHNRATWQAPYYNTLPLGSVSKDGRFYLFQSGWDRQLKTDGAGLPRSDAFIVKLAP
jgi:hypothetical protein